MQFKRPIIFTNGCFDIIHMGHIEYLKQAKSLGKTLIVGLNSDSSVKRLKGESRPINSEKSRKVVLESIKYVDGVFVFDDDDPSDLISSIKPDYFVKGGDYKIGDLKELPILRELNVDIKFLKYIENQSTTGTIKKIKQTK